MTTYISSNINQRINYKASMLNKAIAFGNPNFNCVRIYKSAYEATGEKPHDFIRTYSRSARRHYK